MQQLAELIPIALFFFVFSLKGETIEVLGWQHEFNGILSATAVLMAATVVQIGISFIISKRLEKRQLFVAALVLVAGGLTLVFRNPLFIQWKPTILNGIFALAFLLMPLIGNKKTILERTLGNQLTEVPHQGWLRLNLIWVLIFSCAGILNIIVAYNYTMEQWVSYKLYSAIGFIIIQSLATALVLAPFMKDSESKPNNT